MNAGFRPGSIIDWNLQDLLERALGKDWVRAELSVADEHLYTEQVEAVLRAAPYDIRKDDARLRTD